MRRFWKSWTIILLVALFCGCSGKSEPLKGIDTIQTDNYANKNLDFFYYIPVKVLKDKKTPCPAIICMPELFKRGEDYVSPVFRDFADKEGFIIIAPTFNLDEKHQKDKKSYQYPAIWSGNILERIIKKVEDTNKLTVSKLFFHGFDSGGEFAIRYALWKPDRCAAVSAHSINAEIFPRNKVPVKFLVSVGNDSDREQKVQNYYVFARRKGIDVSFRRVGNKMDLPMEQISESLELFKKAREAGE